MKAKLAARFAVKCLIFFVIVHFVGKAAVCLGSPIPQNINDSPHDIIAGQDFLSVFMGSMRKPTPLSSTTARAEHGRNSVRNNVSRYFRPTSKHRSSEDTTSFIKTNKDSSLYNMASTTDSLKNKTAQILPASTVLTSFLQSDLNNIEDKQHQTSFIRDSRSNKYKSNQQNAGEDNREEEGFTISVPISFPVDYSQTEDPSGFGIKLSSKNLEAEEKLDKKNVHSTPKISSDIQSQLKTIYETQQQINQQLELEKLNEGNKSVSNKLSDAKVISVRVSSSVGTQINKLVSESPILYSPPSETSAEEVIETTRVDTNNQDDNILSIEQPSINADSQLSELTIDEGEPTVRDLIRGSATNRHSVIAEPFTQPLSGANRDYLEQQRQKKQQMELVHPYHQTVVYHDGARARSVSYSTVIQKTGTNENLNWNSQRYGMGAADNVWNEQKNYETIIDKPSYLRNSPDDSYQLAKVANSKKKEQTNYNANSYNYDDSSQRFEEEIFGAKIETPKQSDILISTNEQMPQQKPEMTQWEINQNFGVVQEKPNYQTTTPAPLYTERSWGEPERNYGVPETTTAATISKILPPVTDDAPEENYEVDEAVSVVTNGRAHGVQPTQSDDSHKVGYVVEGRNYKKYRVEERTSDGFIVGEYGVVSNDDGSLRGVRYTADGTINPRLIYDALMKFLSL